MDNKQNADVFDEEMRRKFDLMPGFDKDFQADPTPAFRKTDPHAMDNLTAGGQAGSGAQTAGAASQTGVAEAQAATSQTAGSLPVREKAEKSFGHRDFAAHDLPGYNRGPGIPYAFSNNPRAGQWDARKMSANRIASYKRFVVTDGEGIRNSIYVAGCPFRCQNCWNASIWDFQAGHDFTPAFEQAVIDDLRPSYVEGVTYLGGEPMLNTPVLLKISNHIRQEFGDTKNIWCWTGYTWEELMRPGTTPDKTALLGMCDILIDGRFIEGLKDSRLQFRGSSNQRVIDVKKSLAARREAQEKGLDPNSVAPVIWDKLHDQKRVIAEAYRKDRDAGEGRD